MKKYAVILLLLLSSALCLYAEGLSLKKTKMHCVGYAQVLSTICNYAFSVNGIKGLAKPVVGHVYLDGLNLNQCSALLPEKWRNFTKDHDFVEVSLCDGKTIYVDASLDIVQ